MKRTYFVIMLLLATFVLASCTAKTYEIALVTDVGNIDDKSFNEGAWNGVKEYAKQNDLTYQYFRPSEDTNNARVETIKNAIKKGAKIIVCPGYLFEEAIYEVQDQYPDVAFLLLDGEPHNADYTVYETKENVHCILYKEEQAGYLAGYAAVMEGYRQLGFLGGVDVPPVVRYGLGYVLGADQAAKELALAEEAITIKYWYSNSFVANDEIKVKMDGWYADGTEVVFACGGGIYLNATKAAEEAGKKVIGVDVDQAAESETIITSAEKKLTESVKIALTSFFNNGGAWNSEYAGKTVTLGAAEDCVGLPTNATSWRFANYKLADYQTLFAKLKAGTVEVLLEMEDGAYILPTTSAAVVVRWDA